MGTTAESCSNACALQACTPAIFTFHHTSLQPAKPTTVLSLSLCLGLQASTTLLSWFEASGHNRLWQLLGALCRPAWRQLAAAAAAAGATTGAAAGAATGAAAGAAKGGTISVCQPGGLVGSAQQLVLAGGFQLLCPQPWQQQLVATLAQEPSLLGLLQLLQQLPGVADCRSQQPQQLQQLGARALGAAGDSTDGDGLLLDWPGASEWGQAAGNETADAGRVNNQDSSLVGLWELRW
jgi:hypothetical protein